MNETCLASASLCNQLGWIGVIGLPVVTFVVLKQVIRIRQWKFDLEHPVENEVSYALEVQCAAADAEIARRQKALEDDVAEAVHTGQVGQNAP